MGGSIKRFLAGALSLSVLVMALLLTSGAAGLAATISTESSEAEPGEVIEVSGSIDLTDIVTLENTVTFHWDDPEGTQIGEVGPLLVTSYETTVTIPETATAGEHDIYACNDTCDSATITVTVPTTTTTVPTTTTTVPTTTTAPPTTTTTSPPTTSASSTTTTTDESATTTDPAPGTTSPSTIGAPTTTTPGSAPTGEATATGGPTPGAESSTEDGSVDGSPDQGDDSSSDEIEGGPMGLVQNSYVPPTTSSATSTAPPVGQQENVGEDERRFEVVAAADRGASSLDSPLVLWTAWLLVVLLASGVVANKLNEELDLEVAYFRPMSDWSRISRRARLSAARFGETLRTSIVTPLRTAFLEETQHIQLAAPALGVARQDDLDSLQARFSYVQGDVLQSIAAAMSSWFEYYFLLRVGTREELLAQAARGLEEGAARIHLVGGFLEDLISVDDEHDELLRVYQMAVFGWADALVNIAEGARRDQMVLAREGFARMDEASAIAEGVFRRRSVFGEHPSLSLQLSVLSDLRPPQHVKSRLVEKAKAPWRRALQAAGFPLL